MPATTCYRLHDSTPSESAAPSTCRSVERGGVVSMVRPWHFVPDFSPQARCGALRRRIRSVHTIQEWVMLAMRDARQCPECVRIVASETGAARTTKEG